MVDYRWGSPLVNVALLGVGWVMYLLWDYFSRGPGNGDD